MRWILNEGNSKAPISITLVQTRDFELFMPIFQMYYSLRPNLQKGRDIDKIMAEIVPGGDTWSRKGRGTSNPRCWATAARMDYLILLLAMHAFVY